MSRGKGEERNWGRRATGGGWRKEQQMETEGRRSYRTPCKFEGKEERGGKSARSAEMRKSASF